MSPGNLAQMTGLGSGSRIDTGNPGFAQAPAPTPLPGFTPAADGGQGVADGTETLPIDTTAGKATVVSTPIASPILNVVPGSIAGDGLQGVQISEARQSPGPDVQTINGRYSINSNYAGSTYPAANMPLSTAIKYPDGVDFTSQGFPNFSPYAKARVNLPSLTK